MFCSALKSLKLSKLNVFPIPNETRPTIYILSYVIISEYIYIYIWGWENSVVREINCLCVHLFWMTFTLNIFKGTSLLYVLSLITPGSEIKTAFQRLKGDNFCFLIVSSKSIQCICKYIRANKPCLFRLKKPEVFINCTCTHQHVCKKYTLVDIWFLIYINISTQMFVPVKTRLRGCIDVCNPTCSYQLNFY